MSGMLVLEKRASFYCNSKFLNCVDCFRGSSPVYFNMTKSSKTRKNYSPLEWQLPRSIADGCLESQGSESERPSRSRVRKHSDLNWSTRAQLYSQWAQLLSSVLHGSQPCIRFGVPPQVASSNLRNLSVTAIMYFLVTVCWSWTLWFLLLETPVLCSCHQQDHQRWTRRLWDTQRYNLKMNSRS